MIHHHTSVASAHIARLQFLQVDSSAWNRTTANVRIELSGGALHCFDVSTAR